eukprot:TRINITY_DN39028_c0_g1_i1.p1 TRINITY_DN39028_c0_g1~~TRINITY_DN39028_c0_g1_i1.p1  ORF type:complete len:113 (+),score=9.73 TRINITY_DN39028_c0_g1_i1:329-667(+)
MNSAPTALDYALGGVHKGECSQEASTKRGRMISWRPREGGCCKYVRGQAIRGKKCSTRSAVVVAAAAALCVKGRPPVLSSSQAFLYLLCSNWTERAATVAEMTGGLRRRRRG